MRLSRLGPIVAITALVAANAACGGQSSSVLSSASTIRPLPTYPGSTILPPPTYPGGQPIPCAINTGLRAPFPDPSISANERQVTASDQEGFIAAFAAFQRIPTDIVNVVPSTARAAEMPSVRMEWGIATFALRPDTTVPVNSNAFTSQYNKMVFVREPGCPWAFLKPLAMPFPCPELRDIPLGVQRAWRLESPSPEACAKAYRPPSPR